MNEQIVVGLKGDNPGMPVSLNPASAWPPVPISTCASCPPPNKMAEERAENREHQADKKTNCIYGGFHKKICAGRPVVCLVHKHYYQIPLRKAPIQNDMPIVMARIPSQAGHQRPAGLPAGLLGGGIPDRRKTRGHLPRLLHPLVQLADRGVRPGGNEGTIPPHQFPAHLRLLGCRKMAAAAARQQFAQDHRGRLPAGAGRGRPPPEAQRPFRVLSQQ